MSEFEEKTTGQPTQAGQPTQVKAAQPTDAAYPAQTGQALSVPPAANGNVPANLTAGLPANTQGETESGRRGSTLLIVLAACAVVALLVAFASVMVYKIISGGSRESYRDFGLNEVETPRTVTEITGNEKELTTPQIAAKVRPSIVSVITSDNLNYQSTESGEGSGIVVDADGYIVTNSHVIGDSKQYDVSVVVEDGTSYDAKVIGYDVRSDLAVLKIDAKGLTACEWGDSTQLVLGDYVVAIGNPGGIRFAGSVTDGIVSGVERVIDSSDSDSTSALRYIQTNAAINPGNSGGALVNRYGQVIGINTSKISASGYEGMGFAIPSATAKEVVTDLIQYGYVQGRVKLGITCITISSAYENQGIPAGLQIYEIGSDSDMNGKAQKFDIITHCDGTRITNISQLQDIIFQKKPGDSVRLRLYRPADTKSASSEYEIEVRLLEDTGSKEESRTEPEEGENEGRFGDDGKKY